jgi:C1A family cysteine protease
VNRVYSWRPDLPDQRDFALHATHAVLPEHVDLRRGCSPVKDQGQLGSCTAHAIGGALEFLDRKNGGSYVDASRLFIYYGERALEGTIDTDAGADDSRRHQGDAPPRLLRREALAVSCRRSSRPSPPRSPSPTRPAGRSPSTSAATSLEACLEAVAGGFPVVFGFTVYEGFESAAVAKNGRLELPARGEKVLGGHAVLLVGYDMPSRRGIVRNSWGKDWGQGGYFTIPFPYLTNRNLSDDFWVVQR